MARMSAELVAYLPTFIVADDMPAGGATIFLLGLLAFAAHDAGLILFGAMLLQAAA